MNTTTPTTTTATASGLGNREERPSKSALPPGGTTATLAARPRRQVRLRLTPAVAQELHALPHQARAEAVAMLVNAGLAGVSVVQLLGYRQELKNLGLLINQSLRLNRGQAVNVVALEKAMDIVNKLITR